ncbi:unnamed protein product [Aspergillus oryzae var. brunneus]|uniref:Kinetochore protein Spc24 n=2 Tax=Aspergillus oryzae TaxID=5062 RepID=A0AAN5C1K8_ASPOZ|nr:unnamed protein product [Aspergillus oryzae]GMG35468.1 unnamed protein product [Aspergillus oryzae]GMG44634.1 unnamed protein product [Aspergillus oryzae var. brunneus]
MLLDENPGTVCISNLFWNLNTDALQLIHHTIGNFNIQPDKQAVTRINDSLSTLQQSRELRMREAESSLRKLSRHLHSLNAQHEEAVAAHDSSKHAADMVELDTKKFRIAKAATELEIESERLESELEMLKERLADLEAQGLEGDEATRRERELDDATMWVPTMLYTACSLLTEIAFALKFIAPLALILRPMMRAISTKPSSVIVAKGTCTSLTLTPSSRDFSTPTTSGRPCKVSRRKALSYNGVYCLVRCDV